MPRFDNKAVNLADQLVEREESGSLFNFQDGLIKNRMRVAKSLYRKNLSGHYGCVNAIEFSHGGRFLASGGDDKRVLLWNVQKAVDGVEVPSSMCSEHHSNIFSLEFDKFNEKIFSGGNDDLVILHDIETGKPIEVYNHDSAVLSLSVDLISNNLFATACEDGHCYIRDIREPPTEKQSIASQRASFHSVQFHPTDGNFIATANAKKGATLWDIRQSQKHKIRYGYDNESCMCVRFNRNGDNVLVIRKRLPPVLYNTLESEAVCQFYHTDYYNSCTMKSCCFAGPNDEYILSGSDDFNLYIWSLENCKYDKRAQMIEAEHMVLSGHRSIVNQVRYNYEHGVIASSGVEKIIKLWSPVSYHGWIGGLKEENKTTEQPRDVISREDYSYMIDMTDPSLIHDYSEQNTCEDMFMMAFFDSLVQQELETWNTNSLYNSEPVSSNSSGSGGSSLTTSSSSDESDIGLKIKFKCNPQRNKFPNRIAYLIAQKRYTLRRLAMQALMNRRRYRGKNGRFMRGRGYHSTTSQTHSKRKRGTKRFSSRGTQFPTLRTIQEPHYSNSLLSHDDDQSSQQSENVMRPFNPKRVFNSSSSGDSDSDSDKGATTSQRINNVNLAIPSTSTGITSNGKNDRIRILHYIHYSDDDDDEDEVLPPRLQANGSSRPSIPDDMPMNGSRRRSPEATATPQIQSQSSLESSESSSQESTEDQVQDIDLMYSNASKSESSMSSSASGSASDPPSPVHTSLGKHKFQEPQMFSSDSEASDLVPIIKQKKNNNFYGTNHEERSTDCIDSKNKIVLNSFDSDSEDY
ncbi:DCAF5 family protein [Megaselia abdita]